MKTIKKCGPLIESIKTINGTRKGCLPETCRSCRFFSETGIKKDDYGWCHLGRGRLVDEYMDEVDCPLDYMEGVDERIWGKEDTNPWHIPWKTELPKDEINANRAKKIEKLMNLLKAEMQEASGLTAGLSHKSRFKSLFIMDGEEEFFKTFYGRELSRRNDVLGLLSGKRIVYIDKAEIVSLEDIGNVALAIHDEFLPEEDRTAFVYLVKAILKSGQEYTFASIDESASEILMKIEE